MQIDILFGTESGNSEMVAEDIASAIAEVGDVTVRDMAGVDPADLAPSTFYIVVCSTYGDGQLPEGAVPFFRALEQQAPDLSGMRYAMYGLGDSDYVYSYSEGSEIIDRALTQRGAVRVGEYGRHDAAEEEDPSVLGVAWARDVLAHAQALRA